MPDNLPRHIPLRMGEGALFRQMILDHPVKSDEMAEDVLSVVGFIEGNIARYKAYVEALTKKWEWYEEQLKETEAWKSLKDYVLAHPNKGSKTLVLPSGTVKVSTRKNVLEVLDDDGALSACPEAGYEYQAPPVTKLSREKLKQFLDASGEKTLIAGGPDGAQIVAQLLAEVESVKVTPSENTLEQSAMGPKLSNEAMAQRLLEQTFGEEGADE